MTVPRALPSGEPVVGTNQVWHQLYACDGFTALANDNHKIIARCRPSNVRSSSASQISLR